MKDFRRNSGRMGIYLLCIPLMCVALGSCSLFQSKIKTPVAKKTDVPQPPQPLDCEHPYCTVNLDFPISQVTNPIIYVLKSARRLWLVQEKTLIRDYHVGLGPSPRGDKYFRGDGRTPEGEYFVCIKKPDSQYYKSIGINYPSPRHAENALTSGSISYGDYCSIVQANDAKRLPPSNTCLGGLIFIHGGGSYKDWTLGCVAVQNRAMDELFQVVSIGTPVHILP
ncbi:MAG: murein L,D-transpeptidase family protein [Syntrophobacteraceae bacterium]